MSQTCTVVFAFVAFLGGQIMETSIKSWINSRVPPVQSCLSFSNGSVNLALEEAAKSLVVFISNIIQTWLVKISVLKLLS